ncbi:MAG TPA: GspH/FimT family pseudopilin [Opitutaceae bacterium]|nr:GspH/FimT family pseudopilin [Opitutaceae bacterium]
MLNVERWTFAGRSSAGARAFTLLEILVTLALIALLSGALIAGAGRLVNDRPSTPSEIFRQALTESRQYAIEKNVEVRLSFDPKGKTLVASTTDNARNYPVPGDDVVIDFLAAQKGGSAILVGGEVIETQALPYVTFYPDGTCSPFRVQFRISGTTNVVPIDPWTCAPVLEAPKP